MNPKNRRSFLKILGTGFVGAAIIPPFLQSCGNNPSTLDTRSVTDEFLQHLKNVPLTSISQSGKDEVVLAKGLVSELLISYGDQILEGDTFGFNNDFLCYIPLDANNPDDGLLWVNHEYADGLFVSGFKPGTPMEEKTKEEVDKERYNVGGSIIRIKKEHGKWNFIPNDPYNRRLNSFTEIPFNWDSPIAGRTSGTGTHSNCSGGITPWGTILTCEENYDNYEGETIYDENNVPSHKPSIYGWDNHYDNPPEHFGWVVEVDPRTGEAQKHIAIGRFAHECCTLVELEDKRIVAYSGDDRNNEFIYKFISSKPGSLKEGTLYVADTKKGEWISLNIEEQPLLQEKFKDQTEVLVRVREAARMLGATPQNRPEDFEIDPITGHVIVALTNNYDIENYHGSILKLEEEGGKHDALRFKAEDYLVGGPEAGFSCPDNLAFDKSGNLWFTSDMSGSKMKVEGGPYYPDFINNGLFVVPRTGEKAGDVLQVASAPNDAEFTGPWFSPDYRTLFLSVQHPGENSKDFDQLTSNWPGGGDSLPKPSVICIKGDLLDKIVHLGLV